MSSVPYPGLRPFGREDAGVFFGREAQTDALLRKLGSHRFVAVVGQSGCGKSSLVRAGMIPALDAGFLVGPGHRWRSTVMTPARSPMSRLAGRLLSDRVVDHGVSENSIGFLHAQLLAGPLGLAEALSEATLPEGSNVLVVVDQFEELFELYRQGDREEAVAFVELLKESAAQRQLPIYIVITMRSDFLGDCALFTGLPELLNDSQFLTPRLTREQQRAAIVGPARVFDADVEPALVNRLLNEVSTRPDVLPVLQHLLMRMWMHVNPESLEDDDQRDAYPEPRSLGLDAHKAVGGLTGALSKHGAEILERFSGEQLRLAEVVFRRLCRRVDGRSIRDPATLKELRDLADRDQKEAVASVLNTFRTPGCWFLRPYLPEPLSASTRIDLSHESLIGQWKTLSGWVDEEAESESFYGRIRAASEQWEGGGDLWGRGNLELARVWRKKQRPTPAWAARYGGRLDRVRRFLEASETSERRRSVRDRGLTAVLFVLLVMTIWFWKGAQQGEEKAERMTSQLRSVLDFPSLQEAERLPGELVGGIWTSESKSRIDLEAARKRLGQIGALPCSLLRKAEVFGAAMFVLDDLAFREEASSLRDETRFLRQKTRERFLDGLALPETTPRSFELVGLSVSLTDLVTTEQFLVFEQELRSAEDSEDVIEEVEREVGTCPRSEVSWYEAYGYAAWLGGRLASESEWLAAEARSGDPAAREDLGGGPGNECQEVSEWLIDLFQRGDGSGVAARGPSVVAAPTLRRLVRCSGENCPVGREERDWAPPGKGQPYVGFRVAFDQDLSLSGPRLSDSSLAPCSEPIDAGR